MYLYSSCTLLPPAVRWWKNLMCPYCDYLVSFLSHLSPELQVFWSSEARSDEEFLRSPRYGDLSPPSGRHSVPGPKINSALVQQKDPDRTACSFEFEQNVQKPEALFWFPKVRLFCCMTIKQIKYLFSKCFCNKINKPPKCVLFSLIFLEQSLLTDVVWLEHANIHLAKKCQLNC